jgi:uncharacterized protein YggT (Ycf19 family)
LVRCHPSNHSFAIGRDVDNLTWLLSYWYFHLPNFLLAALMYTLLGRVVLQFFVEPESDNYIWRFFCNMTDPFLRVIRMVTPKAVSPPVLWLLGFVWVFWLRVVFVYIYAVFGLLPRVA